MSSVQQKWFGRSETPGVALRCAMLAAGTAAILLLAPSAYGADYHVPLPDVLRGTESPSVGPPAYPSWDGFYFGAQAGGAFSNVDFTNGNSSQISDILADTELQSTVSNWTTMPQVKTNSGSYGGFLGYNFQWGDVITGVELNYNHMALNAGARTLLGPILVGGATQPDGSTVQYSVRVTSTGSVSIHDVMTTRARFGWTFDRLLPYGFVGVAVGRADSTQTTDLAGTTITVTPSSGIGVTSGLNLPRSPESNSKSQIAYGFTGGLGVEVGVLPNLFLRGEWEFVEFPNVGNNLVQINTVRAAVGMKF